MQVFGLPSHVIRNGRAASRLLAAKTLRYRSHEKTRRRRAMARRNGGWADQRAGRKRRGRDAGHPLPLGEEARTLKPQAASPARPRLAGRAGPRRRRLTQRQSDVGQTQDRRPAAPGRFQLLGFDGGPHSRSARCKRSRRSRPRPAPPAARRIRFTDKGTPNACPKAVRQRTQANSSKSTRSSSTSGPTSRSSTSPPTIRSPNGPSAASQPRPAQPAPSHCSTSSWAKRLSPSAAFRSMAEPSLNPSSKPNARREASNSSCCRLSALILMAASSAPNQLGDRSSTQPTIGRIGSASCRPSLTLSPTDSITPDRTTPLAEELRQSIFKLSAKATPRRLICAEPGHALAVSRLERIESGSHFLTLD